ncbi:hypothetical protein MTR72_25810 [Bradyrhizobium sp. ISRA442]|uniref:hypothetical protein n=1 Tax=Bradyrhizobium sp. ISRA442 TaxID=2866197 RepID=UPI00311B008C
MIHLTLSVLAIRAALCADLRCGRAELLDPDQASLAACENIQNLRQIRIANMSIPAVSLFVVLPRCEVQLLEPR